MKPKALNGLDFKLAFEAASKWLEKIVPDINALNVYPVPDGDCGTNMLLTLRASLNHTTNPGEERADLMAKAIAQGALMGARGNSGVILSQIWRGVSIYLDGRSTIGAKDLAGALSQASDTAYQALSNPVEGTILTVIRETAEAAAREACEDDCDLISVLTAAVRTARASVMKTPSLLPELKEAGVVDAGGHGLYTFIEGMLLHLKNDMDNRTPDLLCRAVPLVIKPVDSDKHDDIYGYCTQFMIKGVGLNVARIRQALANSGESLIVVGDNTVIRVHVHTHDPESAARISSAFGTLTDIDIRDMDEQHQDFLIMNRERLCSSTAVISVASGDGLINAFADLGTAAIIQGGQTMNPSVDEILKTIEAVPCDDIILLPNNGNVVPACDLAVSMTDKRVQVIPTRTIAQGISAMVAFLEDGDLDSNYQEMTEAANTVRTIEITKSTRQTMSNGLSIGDGQFIGLLDGKIMATGDDAPGVIFDIFEMVNPQTINVVTIYWGKDAQPEQAQSIHDTIHTRYPSIAAGVVRGSQPNYHYILSIE